MAKKTKATTGASATDKDISTLEAQLRMAQEQLLRYAEEFNQLYQAERERRRQLEASLKKLQQRHRATERASRELAAQLNSPPEIVGSSKAIRDILERIEQVAPTEAKILISGENGTGKEVVARAIVAKSRRADRPFFIVNCAAIPEELIESELFGHEKGAFTGATERRLGKFELAHTGTLFLDEVGDMSLKTQAKVLRAIDTGGFERVGGKQTIQVDVRIIAATNKDLEAMVKEGTFREDLYYRINVIRFHIPPLRERRRDIPLLAQYFVQMLCRINGKRMKSLSSDALRVLEAHPWPGNVRELKNVIERLVILVPRDIILAEDVREALPKAPEEAELLATTFREARAAFERRFLLEALEANNGNISATAQQLDLNRSYLHTKLRQLGIMPKSKQR